MPAISYKKGNISLHVTLTQLIGSAFVMLLTLIMPILSVELLSDNYTEDRQIEQGRVAGVYTREAYRTQFASETITQQEPVFSKQTKADIMILCVFFASVGSPMILLLGYANHIEKKRSMAQL